MSNKEKSIVVSGDVVQGHILLPFDTKLQTDIVSVVPMTSHSKINPLKLKVKPGLNAETKVVMNALDMAKLCLDLSGDCITIIEFNSKQEKQQ